MAIKDLLVHLDQGERTKARLEMSVELARRNHARLVGIFGQRAKAEQVGIVATWPPQDYVAAAAASKLSFEHACREVAQSEWRDLNRGGDAAIIELMTEQARYADLTIIGQYNDSDGQDCVPPELAEDILANAGRPILVVPYVGEFGATFNRPLIAWNNSREAAHALNDALPLIKGCDEAIVLSLDTRYEEAKASCAAVAKHLACHDIKARMDVLMVEDIGIMDILLNRAADCAADLLIMGAHGHIGFPFVSRGAGTRHILRSMTVPVLMSS